MNLKTNELERYSRQIIIKDIGIMGQRKIKNSKVLIVGLGGLGCPVAEYLSRTGVGTIDSDYRGEIKIILFNHGNEKFLVNNGDRIAQMAITPVLKFEFEETKDLPETLRGSGGFGSTGKK